MTFMLIIGPLSSMSSLTHAHAREERDALVTMLTIARTRAIANVNATTHGVYAHNTCYIHFEGNIKTPPDCTHFDTPRKSTFEGVYHFEQLTGALRSGRGVIDVGNDADPLPITLHEHGYVEW
jgi:hypothetical protein